MLPANERKHARAYLLSDLERSARDTTEAECKFLIAAVARADVRGTRCVLLLIAVSDGNEPSISC